MKKPNNTSYLETDYLHKQINGWRNATIEKRFSHHNKEIPIRMTKADIPQPEGFILHGMHSCELEKGKPVHKITIDKNSDEVNDTLIHELIHAALDDMQIYCYTESLAKLARKVNNREDFIHKLSETLSKKIKIVKN